jgi:putative ABC transport system permease protein
MALSLPFDDATQIPFYSIMLLNYLKVALRAITRFKIYTLINLVGLALGLSTGILIMLYVLDELSYDAFHENKHRVFRVETVFQKEGSGNSAFDANGWPVGATLKKDFPEVERVLYSKGASFLQISHEGKRFTQNVHFADESFFDIFSFRLLEGNSQSALQDPFSAVISRDMAEKYFPGKDALNSTLILADSLSFLVTGVMENIPANSHIRADILLSFSTYPRLDDSFSYDNGWGNINVRNYIMLKEGTDQSAFVSKARNLYSDHAGGMLKDWGVSAQVVFAPLNNLYLTSKTGNGMGPLGSIDRVYLLSGIAAFVILLACINFVNLTTARSVFRGKEVGLRKVVGSTRHGLIVQFLSESFVLTVIALVIALGMVSVFLPMFNLLLAKEYSLVSLMNISVVFGILLLVAVVTFLSGYYPAMVMSGMRPSDVLKGKTKSGSHGTALRRSLVIVQFVISVGLVMGTFVVLKQLEYMQQQELGFYKDEVIVVNAARARMAGPSAHETFSNEVKALSIVENVTYCNALPGRQGWAGQVAYPEGKSGDEAVSVEYIAIDDTYLTTLGLTLLAGENFDRNVSAKLQEGLLLNETAAAMFGWPVPADAIGKKITSPSGYPAGEVIGIVKDYHQWGLQQKIGPVVLDYNPGNSYLYAIRYKAADTRQLISDVEGTWKKHFGDNEFNYFFLNENFERQYQSEQRLASVFAIFAVMTVVIALIGLVGLVAFMVASRTKEIGVRKVLGASTLSITRLLSKEFLILGTIANLIALPTVWYFTNQWLKHYAHKVEVSAMMFGGVFVIALIVILAVISLQTVRAALADPVKSLRYE